ncbi:MAG: hypothetical protein ACRDXX_18340 [Stackebrandtia sp.]
MSSIENLGARVRNVNSELPAGDAARAARHLEAAHAGLAVALRESVEPAGIPELHQAKEHLERALLRLKTASERLDEYLTSIGVGPAGAMEESAAGASAASAAPATGGVDWWRDRVNFISEGDSKDEPREVAVTKLFSELVDAAGRGDRDKYRELLLAAGPKAGVKLPGLAWPMIRTLAEDVLGRAPAAGDDDKLRKHARDPVARVLPKLPEDVAFAQWHGACSLPHKAKPSGDEAEQAAAEKNRAVDAAAVGPVLVAAFLRGREQTRKDG